MLRPPKDVAPEVLFRRLLGLPRPTLPLDYRIKGAEHIALSVRALTGAEYTGSPQAVVAAALLANGKKAFANEAEVGALPEPVADELTAKVLDALQQVSPIYGVSMTSPWHAALTEGARDPSNVNVALSLGSHFEAVGKVLVDRPALFFGVPAVELIDAHWFAYRAARTFFIETKAP